MYTKGPWEVTFPVVRASEDKYIIADVGNREHLPSSKIRKRPEDEERANARLIASAPELLEALKLFVQFFDEMPKGQLGRIVCDIGILNNAFIQSSKAIAKAESKK